MKKGSDSFLFALWDDDELFGCASGAVIPISEEERNSLKDEARKSVQTSLLKKRAKKKARKIAKRKNK